MTAETSSPVRQRLEQAALALFRRQGYDRTSAAQIAAQAGVTERTFFRHFADKREVLFGGEAVLGTALTAAIAQVSGDPAPIPLLFAAFHAIVPLLEGNRAFAQPRQALIAATPALVERELAKLAALAGMLAESLRARGIAPARATLAAQIGMAAFADATTAWLDDPSIALGPRLDAAARDIAGLTRG